VVLEKHMEKIGWVAPGEAAQLLSLHVGLGRAGRICKPTTWGHLGDDGFMTDCGWQRLLFGVLFAALLIGGRGVAAADSDIATGAIGPAAPCVGVPDALGVSRVAEIDTTGGPRFGVPGPDAYPLLQDKEVILTFDDGPVRRYTQPILDALDEQCVKATFFTVGRMALADPQTLRDTAARGHTIASHTWSHKRLDRIGSAASKQEIELGFSATTLALGRPIAPLFRFPYLGESSAMRAHLKTRHIANVAIHIDSRDFLTRNPTMMRNNVMSQLAQKGRGIILFHDIQPSTAGGMRALLKELKAKGYKIVHIVPKGEAATLPEFDAMAEREAQRRKLALSSQPLSDRSVVWPVTPGTPEQLPWATEDAQPLSAAPSSRSKDAPQLPPPARPNLRPAMNDDSWATNPLGRP
jgi:peptidoglycan/xylan/chitin deacetylase (PgdA/CDA1 family)